LAGLAAFNRDSANPRGSRCIWGGRAELRRVLYMATVAAVRSNSSIRAFYLPLRPSGKHAKPALTAGMRKPLVILNAMLRTKTGKLLRWLPRPQLFLPRGRAEHGCC